MDLVQMRFVALCLHGHAQDVPWIDWVHGRVDAECNEKMKFREAGGDLADLAIVCGCGARKSLQGITQSDFSVGKIEDDAKAKYICRGTRPWLKQQNSPCTNPLRVTLINSLNVHFAQTTTSIFLPRSRRDDQEKQLGEVPAELVKVMEDPPVSFFFTIAGGDAEPELLKSWVNVQIKKLKEKGGQDAELELGTFGAIKEQLDGADEPQIARAIAVARGEKVAQPQEKGSEFGAPAEETGEAKYRRMEYNVFRGQIEEPDLRVREDQQAYQPKIQRFFSRVRLVERLRETRVYAGFTRLQEENDLSPAQRAAMLRRTAPEEPKNKWLPAYVVYGEGIFLEFDPAAVQQWLLNSKRSLVKRLSRLKSRYSSLRDQKKVRSSPLDDANELGGARFLLVHTFAHLFINRLVFECGYSTASLRERLYVSDHPDYPMAGLLIYTAAGDSEGTMGGLVRMGRAGRLEPVIYKALEEASWCSGDPVCMELGDRGGQGPDSCNLAACHSCALLPETACEHFNRFLDRGVIVGNKQHDDLGFFHEIIRSR
jgi:hypothetical protein